MFTTSENLHPTTYTQTIVKINSPKSGRKNNESKHLMYHSSRWSDQAINMNKHTNSRHDRNKLLAHLRRNKVIDFTY